MRPVIQVREDGLKLVGECQRSQIENKGPDKKPFVTYFLCPAVIKP